MRASERQTTVLYSYGDTPGTVVPVLGYELVPVQVQYRTRRHQHIYEYSYEYGTTVLPVYLVLVLRRYGTPVVFPSKFPNPAFPARGWPARQSG